MQQFFTVIGGMGTPATESYIRLLNQRTPTHKDQDYLNYILVNHATVPDRTSYILDHSKPNFYPDLLEDIKQQSQLNPAFFALVCNTAHYFYDELQAATAIPILHMPKIAVDTMVKQYPNLHSAGLIATEGTIADGIYRDAIKDVGRSVVVGDDSIQAKVNELIYHDIKENDYVDGKLYHEILSDMVNRLGCGVVILGCTELSLAQEKAPDHDFPVIDPQSIIVDKSIELALKVRQNAPLDV
ncbi:aspartate racemase [Agrilactobacillus composti DSM 18527 = JCM 14202]|uniref:Aspartate racemase n=1 Tax=Agrilactobacillus composti DSM 18527 = JCM 14202 TaxID=1423734 RepID=X0PPH5_9LACO|nr:amino acid racemase [Agrilactobacillus composti]KRM31082.1 aspartate racemase [Agrilactobacillus composti DSM 18527 = JCM 14202]GAF39537.1 aspartate racemase [Agrilactobacillus composti DSM 18527 = JCM 14202]